MSLITLVRHGQASYMQEDYDRLSSVGEQQARLLGEFWARQKWSPDAVYQGPAKRHRRTAELVGAVLTEAGMSWPDPETMNELDEFDAFQVMRVVVPVLAKVNEKVRMGYARFLEVQHTPEAGHVLQELFEDVAREWCEGSFDTPDLESWAQFRARIARAIDMMRANADPTSNIVAFTSAGPVAAALGFSFELTARASVELVWMSRNCSLTEFLVSSGRFTLSAFNSIPHLDDPALLTYR